MYQFMIKSVCNLILAIILGVLFMCITKIEFLPLVMCVVFLTLLISAEWEKVYRTRWCKTRETREWVEIEHLKSCRNLIIGVTLFHLFYAKFSDLNSNLTSLAMIISMVACYYFMPFHHASKAAYAKFHLINVGEVNGFEYQLPPWWKIPKAMRMKLMEEVYRKVPCAGKTHIQIVKGIFRTRVGLFSIRYRRPDTNQVSSEVFEYLKDFPKKELSWTFCAPCSCYLNPYG